MSLKLKTDQSTANEAAKNWRKQYYNGKIWSQIDRGSSESIYDQIVALGSTPDPVSVAKIIGNDSWSTAPMCHGCKRKAGSVVACGLEDIDENYLCKGCLRKALALIEGKS